MQCRFPSEQRCQPGCSPYYPPYVHGCPPATPAQPPYSCGFPPVPGNSPVGYYEQYVVPNYEQYITPVNSPNSCRQPVSPPKTCCLLSPLGECILDLNPTIPSFTVTYTNMAPASHATITLTAAGTCPRLPITIPPGEVVTQTYNCGNISKIFFKNETSTASVEVRVNQ
ncbi:MAG TPA: hypothetical protein VK203_18970 [Nostocaceae cyanobacterium]|nr:hypothetical protein [Nostocaceae cyanobacterium]